ncbi:hypothetical protein K525DRAFT_265344 [Schizophyllum commune Loenen D]|nr:hypothetical protein K525DRAFT_265344 [Schizophyllum commune Loenen D]
MDHVADEWLETGIRTTFAIEPGASTFKGERLSGPTGLGWRFLIEHAAGKHAYRFEFDAFLIHNARLGILTISPDAIQVRNMIAIETTTMVHELPRSGWRTIGTWLVADPERRATIAFLVTQRSRVGNPAEEHLLAFPAPAPKHPCIASPTTLGERALVESLDVGIGSHSVQFLLPSKVRARRVMATRSVYVMRDVCKAIRLCVCEARPRLGNQAKPSPLDEQDYDTDSDISDDDADTGIQDQPTPPVCPAGRPLPTSSSSSSTSFDLDMLSLGSVGDASDDEAGDTFSGAADAFGNAQSATVLNIKHHAHRTWKAFVFYLYTGKIAFRKLSSAEGAGSVTSPASPLDAHPSRCSLSRRRHAKMSDLRTLCIQAIMADITVKNVAHEVFSRFSSKYTEVLEAEMDFLVKHLKESECAQEVQRVMQNATTMPHSGTAIAMVWRKMAN